MKTIEEIKRIVAEHKSEIREKYGVVIVGVFGSYECSNPFRFETKTLLWENVKGNIVYV